MAKSLSPKLTNCLLIVNPGATRFRRGKSYATQLIAYFGTANVITYHLQPNDFKDPKQLQKSLRHLDARSLLAIHGGDGTVNWVVNQYLALRSSAAKQATVLPLWGGNACDIAHMVNGRQVNNISNILQTGQRLASYPLHYRLGNKKHETGDVTRYAIAYLSIGAVAFAARALERSQLIARSSQLPPLRFVCEVLVGSMALQQAKRFQMAGTKPLRVYDIVYINGSRLAKIYPTPAQLHRPAFTAITLVHKYPVFLSHLTKLSHAWLRGRSVTEQSLTLESAAWFQADGEVRHLKAGTTLHVVPAVEPLFLLATH